MTAHQLLRLKQVEMKTGLKRSQVYLYMKKRYLSTVNKDWPRQRSLARI